MNILEILNSLDMESGPFPKEAISEAILLQEEITPELLRILQETVERAEQQCLKDEDGTSMAHFFAMYLLALFRETRAYPLVIRFARLSEEELDLLAGDFITEDLGRVLASVSGGDTALLRSLVADEAAYEYCRGAGVEAFKILAAEGVLSRDEVIDYYKTLFNGGLERSHSQVWSELVSCATRLYPAEVYNEIVGAYEDGLFYDDYISLDSVHNVMKMDRDKVLARLRDATRGFIRDLNQDMRWYSSFTQRFAARRRALDNEVATPLRAPAAAPVRAVKIGPNDPCTCGSGRKYKKCCGGFA